MANHLAVTIPLEHIQRVQIYINRPLKTVAEIKATTGADYILNGTLYNMATGAVNCHLKAEGEVIAKPAYTVMGYGWNEGSDIAMMPLPSPIKNYIACTPLIVGGQKKDKLIYDAGQGGTRGRSAIGIKGNRLALYCTKDGTSTARTPEDLRDDLFAAGWESAVMLDGGGSSQCDFKGQKITSSRKVQHLILVFLKKTTQEDSSMTEQKNSEAVVLTSSEPVSVEVKTAKVNLPILENGSSGAAVEALQMLLNCNGYSCGRVDGDFGPGTESAVKKFQKAKGLTQDGIAGGNTWGAILGA